MLTVSEKLESVIYWLNKIPEFSYNEIDNYVIAQGYGRRVYVGSLEFIELISPLVKFSAVDYINKTYNFTMILIERAGGWKWEKKGTPWEYPEPDTSFYETLELAREAFIYWAMEKDKVGGLTDFVTDYVAGEDY